MNFFSIAEVAVIWMVNYVSSSIEYNKKIGFKVYSFCENAIESLPLFSTHIVRHASKFSFLELRIRNFFSIAEVAVIWMINYVSSSIEYNKKIGFKVYSFCENAC